MASIFDTWKLPLDAWIQSAADVIVHHFRPAMTAMQAPIAAFLELTQAALSGAPPLLVAAIFFALTWYGGGLLTALVLTAGLLMVGMTGLWPDAMTTLAIVIVAVIFTVVIGMTLSILAVQSKRFWSVLKTVLDVMQSTPSFVYLVPVVMLFGIGTVPGVIATMIFAVPPMVKITYLGMTQIPSDLIEVSDAFGATRAQTLLKVRLPLALPAIATGLNQVVMFSLVMSTIVSMIGAEGLGAVVLRAVGRMDIGQAATAGLAIVVLALGLDRMSRPLATRATAHAS